MTKKNILQRYAILTILFFILFAWFCLHFITLLKGRKTNFNKKISFSFVISKNKTIFVE